MDEDLLLELRHNAVDAHMSLSAWITTTLKGLSSPTPDFGKVRARAIKRMEQGFHLGNHPLAREEIHAR